MNSVHLLTAPDIRRLADTVGLRPTKQRGQNFVIDPNTVRRIVQQARLESTDSVLEIGPGLGSLTLALAEVGAPITAIEIDSLCAQQLPHTIEQYAPTATVKILHGDALQVTGEQILSTAPSAPTAMVANLPYNVAVPVLLRMMREVPTLRNTLVMVQAEVADRLAAQPGSRTYGVPSVKARFYGEVERAGAVGKNVFWPAPNVESGLVRITAFPSDSAPWDSQDEELRQCVWEIVDRAFAQRRKTLRSALKTWAGSAQAAEKLLTDADIDPQRRGETLSTADFVRLARCAQQAEGQHSTLEEC